MQDEVETVLAEVQANPAKGINSHWLSQFAAQCETYRVTVMKLDQFGRKHCAVTE